MAKQIHNIELIDDFFRDEKSYFRWLCSKSGLEGGLALLFFATDFRWKVPDDENRAKEALELRDFYAREVGEGQEKAVLDRIKKSIIGPASCFEVFLSLAMALNDMLNMENESKTSYFFHKMMENSGFSTFDDEDLDMSPKSVELFWRGSLDKILDRTYSANGEGSLFGVCQSAESVLDDGVFDQRERPLWAQLNDYADLIFDLEEDETGDFDGKS